MIDHAHHLATNPPTIATTVIALPALQMKTSVRDDENATIVILASTRMKKAIPKPLVQGTHPLTRQLNALHIEVAEIKKRTEIVSEVATDPTVTVREAGTEKTSTAAARIDRHLPNSSLMELAEPMAQRGTLPRITIKTKTKSRGRLRVNDAQTTKSTIKTTTEIENDQDAIMRKSSRRTQMVTVQDRASARKRSPDLTMTEFQKTRSRKSKKGPHHPPKDQK